MSVTAVYTRQIESATLLQSVVTGKSAISAIQELITAIYVAANEHVMTVRSYLAIQSPIAGRLYFKSA